MPPTETAVDGMLCLSRHENCPWNEALKSADVNWTGLQYTCLKILHLYCKVFEKEDVLDMVIRKTCKSCGCDRLKHSVYHEELGSVRDRLGLRESKINHHSYDSPPGLTAKQTELYWTSLAERAPTGLGGATGAAAWRAWRTRALASQLPKQDLSLAHCRHIDENHRKQYEDFVAARNEIALDIGVASQYHGASVDCAGCNKAIRSGSITVQAPRIGEEAYFHPTCFSCAECDELLVELAYCALDGRLYCVRHYAERLKPRCHACDEDIEMGLLLSVVISYAGAHEAIECLKHILSGTIPRDQPNLQELVEYYSSQLRKATNSSSAADWSEECGQGYLSLTEDKNGKLKSAAVKYYGDNTNSTAILFSTKISSFGQESLEESQSNGDYRSDRYIPSKTKTILTNSSGSISVGQRNRSPTPRETISDSNHNSFTSNSVEPDSKEDGGAEEKLIWHYRPLSPTRTPQPLPEIHFQSFDEDKKDEYSEEFLRSLDGIKYRPIQRSDPSGRRRSFRKRHSSSSNSSKESRASREEELKMFTSLEEAEFERMNKDGKVAGFGSTPNLSARSYSRSRSRENSRERRSDHWSVEASVDSVASEDKAELKPMLKDVPKLNSFEEEATETKELIFSGEYTKAMNKDWHSGHFCCWQCDESLTGQRYVLRDEHPYCIKCYESVFANGCEECNKTIGIDSKDLSYKDKHWHEACFLCAKCRVSLVDKQFGSKLDKIYCGNCYDAQFASRCDGCGEVFRAGTKKMEYKTRQWHEKCFCCVVCKNPIGTRSFIPREQEIYCAGCYEDKFATRCVKCNKIITQGGVTYKNEPWHRECFTCTNCNTSLAGQRFTSRDEKPYCAECFGELFAKRCTSCTKPITGIGGTRFISFEDRHWHNDCFICAQCQTSLVGKGFITDGPDIICPECAKQKLM